MSIDFCDNIDLGRKIFKCISLKDKTMFIFMNIYFLQNDFKKGDKITYHLEKGNGYGIINSIEGDILIIKDDNGPVIKLPRINVNKINLIHNSLRTLQSNIENKDDPFKNINDDDFEKLKDYFDMDKEDWIDFLSPQINEDYSLKFIFDDTFYEDDTNKVVLMKISQRCTGTTFEGSNYIYATYEDLNRKNKAVGFDYINKDILNSKELLDKEICDLIKIEEKHTDASENNITVHDNKLNELFENNKILNNTIYFISFNDFVDRHELEGIPKYEIAPLMIDCEDITYQLKSLKNRVINKYWPELIREEIFDIIGENEIKNENYNRETNLLKNISLPNKIIYGTFTELEEKKTCDNIEISYFKLNKKVDVKNTVDIYKLFCDFKLSTIVPFIKWNGSTYENKYYKIHKESMIYEGYDILRSNEKTIDMNLCEEWTKDFYRNERPILDQYGLFNNLHKTDILFLKICSHKNQLIYGTLVIHINGDIEFIIKKNNNDILNINSQKQIKNLIKTCNSIINSINEQNIYSENNIIDFGKEKEINEIFEKETIDDNNIEFLDFNVYYDNNNYEVKKGIKQKEYDKIKKNPGFDSLKPPFLLGERSGLALPLLSKIIKKLPSFFREIDEIDNNQKLLCHYKKVNNYSNRTTLQSAIDIYSSLSSNQIAEEIINKVDNIFNGEFSIKEITDEYNSWSEMNKDENKKDKNIIEENGPDILITNTLSSIVFSVSGVKTFPELKRITLIIKTIMELFNKYINQDDIYNDIYLRQYFEDEIIDFGEISIQKEPPKKKTVQQLFDDSTDEDSSSTEGTDSDENLPSSDESDISGGGGKYDARSYYLKRLKANDKKLFVFKSEKFQTDKYGNKTNTRYGYPKICQGAKGLGSRQPISITKEELDRINNSEELGSGIESYSGEIQVPGREKVDGKEIFYICPQYWDISRELPIRSDYIDENYTKKDIIPEVLPKDGHTDNFILERKGTYWDGVPRELPHKYIVPGLLDNIIHPDGYPLPCCFSLAKGSNKSGMSIEEKMKSHFKQFENKKFNQKEEKPPIEQVEKIEKSIKINTKSIGPLEPGKYSQLPIKLQIMLSQDLIFKYDPELTVSNGLIRLGVPQNKGKTIFTESSFINSYNEIIDYKKSSQKFIQEEIIKKLENDIELFQKCSTIQKLFKKSNVTKEDDISYIEFILSKPKNIQFVSQNTSRNIKTKLKDMINNEIILENNSDNYFYHLILTLKNYRDFLLSEEEKNDNLIIPVLNVLTPIKMNIIIFEKIGDSINIKPTEYIDTNNLCFILKDGHYYEPIIYRVRVDKNIEEIKIFSKQKFSTFEYFKQNLFIQHIQSPYPRGRKKELRSGININKIKDISLKNICSDNFCREWITYEEYVEMVGIPEINKEIKWISNENKKCENDGNKLYGKIKKINDQGKFVITHDNIKVNFKDILIKSNEPKLDKDLINGITQKDDWVWIGGNCKGADKDIESLIRKKYDSTGDKLLLKLSNQNKPQINKNKYGLQKAISSNFYIINKIIKDLTNIIKKDIRLIKLESYEKEDYEIKEYIINNYSEIVYLIAKKKDKNDRIIPIEPINELFIRSGSRKIKKKISFKTLLDFEYVINYIQEYDLKILNLISNKNGFITCIIFKNNTYLPVKESKIKDEYYSNYGIIESDHDPSMIDKKIYNNGIGKNEKVNYINDFNRKNHYKKSLFNHLLNIINEKNIIINGIPRADSFNKNIGDLVYFTKNNRELIYISKNEYYLYEHKMFQKLNSGIEIPDNEIPYYGAINEIKGSKIFIKCTLNHYITNIIKDKITVNQYKINKLQKIIYADNHLPNQLSIVKNDIFKIIKKDDFDLLDDFIQYSIDGREIKNPTFEEKSNSEKYIFINEDDKINKYDNKLILEFINKLIININNGREIRNMNKLVNDVIKITDIEKNIPDTEAFYRYSKDKDILLDTIKYIYTKKSNYLQSLEFIGTAEKRFVTKKLENIPFYINKLFGYKSQNIFSIDNKGDDWYTLINSIKQLKIPYKIKNKYYPPNVNDKSFINIIIEAINSVIEVDEVTKLIQEYNKYNIMRYGITFEKFKTKEDIINYWLHNETKKINVIDLKLFLKELNRINYNNLDLGILIISFNGRGKNYIEFIHTDDYYLDTPVLLLHHVKYNGDYVLSNISKEGSLSLTINELYQLNDDHKQWIKEDKLKVKECVDKSILLRKEEEGIIDSQEEIDYLKDKIENHKYNIEKLKEEECD